MNITHDIKNIIELSCAQFNNTKSHLKAFETAALNDLESWKQLSSLSIKNCEKLTLSTTIKDRLIFLKKSLPNWLKFPFKKIIIVDWDSSENIKEFIDEVQDGRIVYVKVENEPEYRHAAARNFKMRMTDDEDIVLSIDCDILLTWKFLNNIIIRNDVIYTLNPEFTADGTAGTSIFSKKIYFDVGGCDERMKYGWGREDIDLFERISKKHNHIFLAAHQLVHQKHGDDLRVKFTKEKNKWISNAKNLNSVAFESSDTILNEPFINPYTIYYPNGEIKSFNS